MFSVSVTSLGTKNDRVFPFLPTYPIPSTTEHTKLRCCRRDKQSFSIATHRAAAKPAPGKHSEELIMKQKISKKGGNNNTFAVFAYSGFCMLALSFPHLKKLTFFQSQVFYYESNMRTKASLLMMMMIMET